MPRGPLLVRACLAGFLAWLPAANVFAVGQPGHVAATMTGTTDFPNLEATVSVLDAAGLPVTDLDESEFWVTDGNETASITAVHPVATLPSDLAVVLVLDASGSMQGQPLTAAVSAINDFVAGMDRQALIGAVSLGGDCVVTGPKLSHDKSSATDFFSGAVADGNTPLYDALVTAVQASTAAPEGHRLVIALTDGEDNCSRVDFNTVVDAAIRRSVPITVVGLGPDVRADVLQNLAALTGGQFLAADDSSDLAGLYRQLSTRLRTQYVVDFRSPLRADRQDHTVVVHVRSQNLDANGEAHYTPPVIQPALRLSLTPSQPISVATRVDIDSTTPVQLSRANVYLDETLVQVVSGAPLSYILDPSGIAVGSHLLRVHAWDTGGGEAEQSMPLEFEGTGLFGGSIPLWMTLAAILLLPILLLVGIVVRGGRSRLQCPTCRRRLQATWSTCPYCSRPRVGSADRAHAHDR